MDQSSFEFGSHQMLYVQMMNLAEEHLKSEGSSLGSNTVMCIIASKAVRRG
jgi:hypothetical protein